MSGTVSPYLQLHMICDPQANNIYPVVLSQQSPSGLSPHIKDIFAGTLMS